jgi:CrcB protein
VIKILIIGSGGFLGAVLRYYASGYAQSLSGSYSFPVGTLAVNLIGCFIIGAISKLAEDLGLFSIETRLFLTIGFLGAFTTYSTFGYETLNLLRDNEWMYALTNVGLHLFLGIGAVWVGRSIALLVWR